MSVVGSKMVTALIKNTFGMSLGSLSKYWVCFVVALLALPPIHAEYKHSPLTLEKAI